MEVKLEKGSTHEESTENRGGQPSSGRLGIASLWQCCQLSALYGGDRSKGWADTLEAVYPRQAVN